MSKFLLELFSLYLVVCLTKCIKHSSLRFIKVSNISISYKKKKLPPGVGFSTLFSVFDIVLMKHSLSWLIDYMIAFLCRFCVASEISFVDRYAAQKEVASIFRVRKRSRKSEVVQKDLDKDGWKEVFKGTGSTCWIKSFPEEEVPIRLLFTFDMPIPAETAVQMLHPSTQESRHKWDDAFVDMETLEAYSDGGFGTYMRAVTSRPLTDRSFMLFFSPIKKTDWH